MKAQPPVFFAKGAAVLILAVMPGTAVGAQQGYASPAAVQAPAGYPANYRAPGSAYRPPGLVVAPTKNGSAATTPPQPQYAAPRQAAQPTPRGYQPGFGTPPQGYRPPALKGGSTGTASSKAGKSPAAKKRTPTLESKVARLEKNDAQQDRRLNRLEGHPDQPPSSAVTSEELYTVRSGDTLWRIADRHGTSINALKSANRLTSDTIALGQTLRIPGTGGSSTAPVPAIGSDEFSGDTQGAYIVRPGDNFNQIAKTHGVTPDELAMANRTAYPDRLLPGERLVIPGRQGSQATPTYTASSEPATIASAKPPATSVSSRTHTVKKGESLMGIARTYGVSSATLVAANKLKNANFIQLGQRLVIPGQKSSPASAPTAAPTYPGVEGNYSPPSLDSSLAEGGSPASAPVAALPPLSNSFTQVSTKTPAQSSNSRGIVAYRLEKGDDINTVAALFNTTPEKIRELNKLPPGQKLREGDELVVPSLGAVSLN